VLITVETNEILVVRFLKAKITLFKSGILTVEKIKTAARAKKILQKFLHFKEYRRQINFNPFHIYFLDIRLYIRIIVCPYFNFFYKQIRADFLYFF